MVTAIVIAIPSLFVRPFSQPSHVFSPTAFILSPQPFEILPSLSPFPILAVAILPFPSYLDYSFGNLWLMVGDNPIFLIPFSDQPFYDPQNETFYAFYWGMMEGLPEGTVSLDLFATFLPLNPQSSPLWVKSRQMVFVLGQGEEDKGQSERIKPMTATTEPVCCCLWLCVEVPCVDKGMWCGCPLCCCVLPDEGDGNGPPSDGDGPQNPGEGDDDSDEGDDNSGGDEDDGGEPPLCGGISYKTPSPYLTGYIVKPAEEEINVTFGDTLNLEAKGSPDPDLDISISRAPDPESGGCSSSETNIHGPPLLFTWRLWEDTNGDGRRDKLLGVIGYGRQISWRVPEKEGIYHVELVVDDDFDPDRESSPEKIECEKCTVSSTSDDPAVRDWVKVNAQGEVRLLSSSPHHIVYRRQPEPIPPPEEEEAIGPEFGDPVVFDEGENYEPDTDLGAGSEETEVPPQEPAEQYIPPVTINPTPNPELDHPTISFSVKVIGYKLWQATVIIYPVASKQPKAIYRQIYPSNRTSVTIYWDDIFPEEKPPTGVYTYDIIVEGISSPSLAATTLKMPNRDKRLSENPSISNFQVATHLDPETGLITLSMKFQALNENGTEPQVEKATVELRNFKGERVETITMQRVVQDEQVWWQGSGNIILDASDKIGLWRLVACADVKEGDKVKVVREVEKKLLIQVKVSDIALGFRVWREQQIVTEERERRYPYAGDQVLFRVFLKVTWEISIDGQRNEKVCWYSSNPVQREQLSYYSWIGKWNGRPQDNVLQLPQGLANILEPKVTWRRFYNIVVHNIGCGEERQHRWYGMRYEDLGESFTYQWEAEVGTSWWGAKIEWWKQQNGKNGNRIRYRMAFLYPTNQRRGQHLVRLDRLDFNRGYNNQIIWTPNPWETRDTSSRDIRDVVEGGRISARQRWWVEEIDFADDDPFFANYPDRNAAMIRQAELHRRILEWAYSFLNVPYSWDGRSYGGRQSVSIYDYTCTGSHNRAGINKGIDCSEFVSIAAEFGGRHGGPRYTGGLATTNLARTLLMPNANVRDGISNDEKGWIYVRPGDFAVYSGKHVFYVRETPTRFAGDGTPEVLQTIEAAGENHMVLTRDRREGELRQYIPRRWIVP